jgi:hypothetical protein
MSAACAEPRCPVGCRGDSRYILTRFGGPPKRAIPSETATPLGRRRSRPAGEAHNVDRAQKVSALAGDHGGAHCAGRARLSANELRHPSVRPAARRPQPDVGKIARRRLRRVDLRAKLSRPHLDRKR